MFRKWLKENKVSEFDYSGIIFEKASNRNFWAPKAKKEYILNAEKYLRYEWPIIRATDYIAFVSEGNRIKQETPHFARRNALIALVIGEITENKGRFIPDIIDGIFNICEESFWGLSAHQPPFRTAGEPKRKTLVLPDVKNHYIDLFAAETGSLIAVTLHILYDEIYSYCPDITERIEYELNERIIKTYLNHDDYGWMGNYGPVNNWNPWILSNIITVFLLSQISKCTLYNGIEKMLYEINAIYKAYNDDGGCDEGISYWSVSGGTLFEFCEQLFLATNGKINFFTDSKIKNIADYPYKAYIGNNRFVNFADGPGKGLPSWKSILYMFGKRTGNENLCRLAKDLDKCTEVTSVNSTYIKRILNNIILEDEIENQDKITISKSKQLPDIQNCFSRIEKWYFAAKGGHNKESHNHNDVGSFIACYENTPILIDPGCGVYTKKTFSDERYDIWTMQSGWHNTPRLNGTEQHDGENFKADRFEFTGKKCIISFADSYEKSSNTEKLLREISISTNGIEIKDEFKFNAELNLIEENFITTSDVEIKENSVIIGNKFILDSDCDSEIIVVNKNFDGDTKLINDWNTDSINRIIFKFSADSQKIIKFTLKRAYFIN